MVEEFTLTNLTTMSEVTFGQEVHNDFLIEPNGIDWGSAKASHNTYTFPGQVGTYISSTNVKEREISIKGYAFYILSEEDKASVNRVDWIEYGYQKILEKKEVIGNIINPLDYLRIEIGDYYIEGKPTDSVKFGTAEENNNQFFCNFTINLFCNNPMFRKKSEVQTKLSGSTPKFHFPLVFPQNKGIIFGVRENYRLLAMQNDGVATIGCKVRMIARGPITNPTVRNVTTGESITINKTLVADEEVIINTSDGEYKNVIGIVNGEELNYFKYWDFENQWLKFKPGISIVGYSVDEGDEENLDVSIEISPQRYILENL